jgi:serine/threonine-protein kinase
LINARSLFSKMEADDSLSVPSGEYRLLAPVSGEDVCLVFKALEHKSGRERTMVTPHIDFWGVPEDAGVTEAFETFAQSLFQWTAHPNENLLEIEGLAQDDDGRLFFVVDLEAGRRLAEVIRQEAPLPLWRACALSRQIAFGLGALHAGGLIHGGAVPNHILVTGRPGAEKIKVLPVGLQKHLDVWSILNGSGVESTGRVPADFRYFAPEQITQAQLDARTDLHTIGVVLYEMLTAGLPFRGTGHEYLRARMTEPPLPFAVARPNLNLPKRLEALVVRLLARDPSRRPANVQELIREITQLEVDLRRAA